MRILKVTIGCLFSLVCSLNEGLASGPLTAPLQLMTCELLLSPRLREFSTRENPLPLVRDIRDLLQRSYPQAKNDGSFYGDIFQVGPIHDLGVQKAKLSIARLNAIEEHLENPNLDHQIATFEIRGSKLVEALQLLQGDASRHILLDQFVYYDPIENEPVWLLFYRAMRSRPAGRKPTQNPQIEAPPEAEWTPKWGPKPADAN